MTVTDLRLDLRRTAAYTRSHRDPADPPDVLVLGRRRADTVGMEFTHRVATMHDLGMLGVVMDAAIGALQRGFLSPEEIESNRAIMGIDTQLIKDGTYYVVLAGKAVAGCGGWSRRAHVVRR